VIFLFLPLGEILACPEWEKRDETQSVWRGGLAWSCGGLACARHRNMPCKEPPAVLKKWGIADGSI
jgi:hypothetical protein